eukprot:6274135-Amphidinium_carterae.1
MDSALPTAGKQEPLKVSPHKACFGSPQGLAERPPRRWIRGRRTKFWGGHLLTLSLGVKRTFCFAPLKKLRYPPRRTILMVWKD